MILHPPKRLGEYTIRNNKVYCNIPNASTEVNQYCNLLANKIYKQHKDPDKFNTAFSCAIDECLYTGKIIDGHTLMLDLSKIDKDLLNDF